MSDKTASGSGGHTAGALDIRNIIGGLLAVYGVILVVLGLFFETSTDDQKTGDVNANLWAGLALVVVGVAFLAWARLRPIVVPEHVESADEGRPAGH